MLSEFLQSLGFAFGVTGPIFVMVFIGIGLKVLRLLDDDFMNKASKLVFMVALPALLFTNIVKSDLQTVLNPALLGVSVASTLLIFIMLSTVAPWLVKHRNEHGIFIQGAFRANLAIIGLAFCFNAYGEEGLARASILMSVLTLLYNVLSVYTLSVSLSDKKIRFSSVMISLAKNPLIISILLALMVKAVNLSFPPVLEQTGAYLSQMTLPLALLCIGGTISFSEMRTSSSVAILSVIAKLIITPAIIIYIAYLWGFSGMDLGILFLMVSAPSAAVSYVMVQAMGGNAKLAANIVVVSTLASLFTVSFGLVTLKSFGII